MSIEGSLLNPGAARLWMKVLSQGRAGRHEDGGVSVSPEKRWNGSQKSMYYKHMKDLRRAGFLLPESRFGQVQVNPEIYHPESGRVYWADGAVSWNIETATLSVLDALYQNPSILFWSKESTLYGTLVRTWKEEGFPVRINMTYDKYLEKRRPRGYPCVSMNTYYNKLTALKKRGLIHKKGYGRIELCTDILTIGEQI